MNAGINTNNMMFTEEEMEACFMAGHKYAHDFLSNPDSSGFIEKLKSSKPKPQNILSIGNLEISKLIDHRCFEITVDTNDEGSIGYQCIDVEDAKRIIYFLNEQL